MAGQLSDGLIATSGSFGHVGYHFNACRLISVFEAHGDHVSLYELWGPFVGTMSCVCHEEEPIGDKTFGDSLGLWG